MNQKQLNIFIVDDNKVFSLALEADIETAFQKLPIKLHLFETGEQCMEKFKQLIPQIVILDYFLNSTAPDAADGIEVLNRIKKEFPKTNVIILTSNDNLDIAVQAMQHGASDYVVKTETQFKKINYSLANIFRIIEKERNLRDFKQFVFLFVLILTIIGIIIIAIHLAHPELLNRNY